MLDTETKYRDHQLAEHHERQRKFDALHDAATDHAAFELACWLEAVSRVNPNLREWAESRQLAQAGCTVLQIVRQMSDERLGVDRVRELADIATNENYIIDYIESCVREVYGSDDRGINPREIAEGFRRVQTLISS